MTSPNDAPLPPIASIPAETAAETKATLATQYKAAGYDDAALAAAGLNPAAAPPVVNNNVTVTQVPGSNVAIMSGSGITHDQAVSSAKHLLDHGIDPAIVLAAAASHGVTAAELAVTPPSAEATAAAQRDTDVAKGFAPPPEGKYELQFGRGFAEASEPGKLAALNKDIQAAFKSAGVPAALGQPLLDSIMETGEKYADNNLSDDAKQMMWRDEGSILRRAVPDINEHSRFAAIGYAALPKAFRDQLDKTYSLHSARAQIQLEHLGRALEYRKGK